MLIARDGVSQRQYRNIARHGATKDKPESPQNTHSESWGPSRFQEKRSWSEKAILGALGEFRGILGAALGIQKVILGMRNSILGMASHDLINTKTTILGATPGAIPGIDGNPHERFSFAPTFVERFFKNWGGPRAPDVHTERPQKRKGVKEEGMNTTSNRNHDPPLSRTNRTVTKKDPTIRRKDPTHCVHRRQAEMAQIVNSKQQRL